VKNEEKRMKQMRIERKKKEEEKKVEVDGEGGFLNDLTAPVSINKTEITAGRAFFYKNGARCKCFFEYYPARLIARGEWHSIEIESGLCCENSR
jgi:hypothetical protein